MKTRMVKTPRGSHKEFFRICKCGKEEWVRLNKSIPSRHCKKCAINHTRTNNNMLHYEDLPEDEDRNQDMIAQFLKGKEKVEVEKDGVKLEVYVKKKPKRHIPKTYTPEPLNIPDVVIDEMVEISDFDLKFPIALKAVRKATNLLLRNETKKIKEQLKIAS